MFAEEKNHFQWLQFLWLFLHVPPGWLGPPPFFSLLLHFFLWVSIIENMENEAILCLTMSECMCACSVVSDSATPWTVTHLVPLFMELSKQEQWSRLSFPTPGDLPDPGIQPASPALAGGFFITMPPGKSMSLYLYIIIYIRTVLTSEEEGRREKNRFGEEYTGYFNCIHFVS